MKPTKIKQIFILSILLCSISFAQIDYTPGYKAGKPVEMQKLNFLNGEWDITLFYPDTSSKDSLRWVPSKKSFAIFTPLYNGAFFLESFQGFPLNPPHEGFASWEYMSIYSYDRFLEKYRCAVIDNLMGLMDLYNGTFENDVFLFSNLNTETFNNSGTNRTPQKSLFKIFDFKKNKNMVKEFSLIWFSVDEKKIISKDLNKIDWKPNVKMIYKREKN